MIYFTYILCTKPYRVYPQYETDLGTKHPEAIDVAHIKKSEEFRTSPYFMYMILTEKLNMKT